MTSLKWAFIHKLIKIYSLISHIMPLKVKSTGLLRYIFLHRSKKWHLSNHALDVTIEKPSENTKKKHEFIK